MEQSAQASKNRLLVWVGHIYFAEQMAAHGWRVVHINVPRDDAIGWPDILERTGGEVPEALLVADVSLPPFVLGMEDFPCLTLFYVIDSHVQSWYPIYAQAFDLCLITLREHLGDFATGRLEASRLLHMPSFALESHNPPDPMPEKEWDLVFAGTMLRERNPVRHDFLTRLKERLPRLHITGDRFAHVYPRARLVLNESSGELNYRVFEALSHKSCLLTPDIGPAIRNLFEDGKELFLYPPHDVEAVAALVERLLADAPLREAVAEAGYAAINARHRGRHRAALLAAWLDGFFAGNAVPGMIRERQSAAPALRLNFLRPLYLHHAESVDSDRLRARYLETARRASLFHKENI